MIPGRFALWLTGVKAVRAGAWDNCRRRAGNAACAAFRKGLKMTAAVKPRRDPRAAALMMLTLAIAVLALASCAEPPAECEAGVADIARSADVMPPC